MRITLDLKFPPSIEINVSGTINVVHSGEVHVILDQPTNPAIKATLSHGPIAKQ